MPGPAGEITQILHRLHDGDPTALDQLFPLVYAELRASAARAVGREHGGHTLHATDLVHEAYFKLAGASATTWQGRAHFYGVAGRAMRQVLVEHARRRLAEKRGGGAVHVTLGDRDAGLEADDEALVALDEALTRLGDAQPRLRAVVEHRFFGGLQEREIAELLGVSERTVQREWVRARAWLYRELYP